MLGSRACSCRVRRAIVYARTHDYEHDRAPFAPTRPSSPVSPLVSPRERKRGEGRGETKLEKPNDNRLQPELPATVNVGIGGINKHTRKRFFLLDRVFVVG